MCSNRSYDLLPKVILALTLMVVPVWAQIPQSGQPAEPIILPGWGWLRQSDGLTETMVTPVWAPSSQPDEQTAPVVAPVWIAASQSGDQTQQSEDWKGKTAPWLVTIVHELSVKEVIAQLRARGYRVTTLNKSNPNSDSIFNVTSGLVINPSGQIVARLANFQDRPRTDRITVLTADGRRLRPKKCEYDPATGYVVLEVPDFAVEPPESTSMVNLGQEGKSMRLLFTVPRRNRPSHLRWSFQFIERDAIVSRKESDGKPTGEMVLRGNKRSTPDGSVVLNRRGQVIGLMELKGPSNGIIKPMASLRSMASRLMNRNRVHRRWLGVRATQLTDEQIKKRFGPHSASKAGLWVRDVFPGSPAARADLKPNDYIRSFDGQVVRTLRDISALLARTPIGQEVRLEILRDGQLKNLKVRIQARPKKFVSNLRARERVYVHVAPLEDEMRNGGTGVKNQQPGPGGDLHRWGLAVEPLDDAMRRYLGMFGSRSGVLVTEVMTKGLAGRAGLRAGDVIDRVNGELVLDDGQFMDLIRKAASTGRARLVIRRFRQRLPITLDFSNRD